MLVEPEPESSLMNYLRIMCKSLNSASMYSKRQFVCIWFEKSKFVIILNVGLSDALLKVIRMRENEELIAPEEKHDLVCRMYRWPNIAKRTEKVYLSALHCPRLSWYEGLSR